MEMIFFNAISERSCNGAKIRDKPAIKRSKSMKNSDIMDWLGNRPIVDCFNLAKVHSDAFSSDDIPKKYNFNGHEKAFL